MPDLRAFVFPSLLALTAALSGCGLSGPAHDKPAADAAAVIDLGLLSFKPQVVHVHAGQTVEWRNSVFITHNVTDDKSMASDASDAAVPQGATPFNSGDIPAGEVYSVKFTVPGTYKYFCHHHEGEGMVGTVVVDPAP